MPRIASELESHVAVARRNAGLTQEDLGRQVGASRQTISAIEKGEYNLSTVLALRIAHVLESRVEDLFTLPQPELTRLASLKQSP